MKIALFGGSFNPIHNGHIRIASELLNRNLTDEIWFIPCGNHAFGKELASGKDRINMLSMALKNNKMKVIDIETKSNKKSYASETIRTLKKNFPDNEFYFVIGSDNLKELDKWHDFEYLRDNIEFILITRDGFDIPDKLKTKIKYILRIRNRMSSTQIRKNLKKEISIKSLVPEEIEQYIQTRRIYK